MEGRHLAVIVCRARKTVGQLVHSNGDDTIDLDGDGTPDACDADNDNDGVPDVEDRCPGFNDAADEDGDLIPDGCDDDLDNDGVPNADDACPGADDRVDGDADGLPDGCDPDLDNDGVPNEDDRCDGGDDALDADGDGTPDACDADNDNDGVPDAEDRCPGFNDAADEDGDLIPDGCDDDLDNDGVANADDVCPGFDDGADADADGLPDGCDPDADNDGVQNEDDQCPGFDDALDEDGDGLPDGCDADADNDGVNDADDACPGFDDRLDLDMDGLPDECDPDDDNDGTLDAADLCPGADDGVDGDGDGLPDACDPDADNDGVQNEDDLCPGFDDTEDADGDGLPDGCDTDADNDGVPDEADRCPGFDDGEDADGDLIPDGCDDDADNDGTPDTDDICPGFDDSQDQDGDGQPDGCDDDADNDGVPNAADACPGFDDAIDTDGDGLADGCDDDADNDGVPDAEDVCADGDDTADADGDGIPDACDEGIAGPEDTDGDRVPDGLDNCPERANPAQLDSDGDGIGNRCDDTDDTVDDPGISDEVEGLGFRGGGGCDQTAGGRDLGWWWLFGLLFLTRRGRRWAPMAVLLIALLPAPPAQAQDGGMLVEQFEVRSTPMGLLNLERPAILGTYEWSTALWMHASSEPLLLAPVTDDDTRPSGKVVPQQTQLTLTGAFGLTPGAMVSAAVPVVFNGADIDYGVAGRTATDLESAGLGDPRLTVLLVPSALLDFRWPGFLDGHFDLGLSVTVYAPLGDTEAFTGEDGIRTETRLSAHALLPARLQLTLNAAYLARDESRVHNFVSDDVFRWGVGLSAPVQQDWVEAFGVVYGSQGTADQFTPGNPSLSLAESPYDPIEDLAGARFFLPGGLRATLAGGRGLNQGIGAPAWRVVFQLGFRSTPPNEGGWLADVSLDTQSDLDLDLVANIDDLCPNEPETHNGVRDDDGCPETSLAGVVLLGVLGPDGLPTRPGPALSPLADSDGDGISDRDDLCPEKPEDGDGFQDADGCPELDDDGDDIDDEDDACPRVYGPLDGADGQPGCPLAGPDADGDAVEEELDLCPLEAETYNGVRDGDGCPEAEASVGSTHLKRALADTGLTFLPSRAALETRDTDGDGIADRHDLCPETPGDRDGYADADGCPEADNDGDGIADGLDACPQVAEIFNGYADGDGCPDLGPDNDTDGVPDADDRCPFESEVVNGVRDFDGCPDTVAKQAAKTATPSAPAERAADAPTVIAPTRVAPLMPRSSDRDGDTTVDLEDLCPAKAEDWDGFEDADGCPDPDNDQDGIVDTDDACPLQSESFNGFDDLDGCPDAAPKALEGVSGTVRGIVFRPGSAALGDTSIATLQKVVLALRAQPELGLTIEGHTDSAGRRQRNLTLSQQRADAVKAWLVGQGIESTRLDATGLGPDRPVASNRNARGRAQNRRVELKYSTQRGPQ